MIRRIFTSRDAVMTYILLALIVLSSFMIPRFAQPRTATFLVLDILAILMMALPMTFIMVAGDIDLSVASVAGLSSAALGVMFDAGIPLLAGMVACLLIGLGAGTINGVLTARVGLPAMAVTIGTMALFRGLALVTIGDRAVANFPKWARELATGTVGSTGVPGSFLVVLVFAVIFGLWLHMTPYGRGLFALGNSTDAARFVGVNTVRTRIIAFIASGLMASLAGIFWTLRYSSARSDNAEGLELMVIAAVVLGGVSVFGGRGSIWGSVVGVGIIGVVNYSLRIQRTPEEVLVTVTGLLLIISVVAPSIAATIRDWRHRRRSRASSLEQPSSALNA